MLVKPFLFAVFILVIKVKQKEKKGIVFSLCKGKVGIRAQSEAPMAYACSDSVASSKEWKTTHFSSHSAYYTLLSAFITFFCVIYFLSYVLHLSFWKFPIILLSIKMSINYMNETKVKSNRSIMGSAFWFIKKKKSILYKQKEQKIKKICTCGVASWYVKPKIF